MNSDSDIWVVIPAYNEEHVISQVLEELGAYPFKVVVVDDGSSDKTAIVAAHYPVVVLRHITNLGQGAALQTALTYAAHSERARFVVTFDADGQHHASDIQPMVDTCRQGNYDIVLGSRFINGGQAENMSPLRGAVLQLAILFSRWATGLKLTDTHNGLRAMTRDTAARISLTQNGMAHASEILSRIAELKLSYCEFPVTVTYTDYSKHKGQSLFNSINILWELLLGKMK